MIQVAIIAGIILSILGGGVLIGKKWERSVWQPTYFTLASQMTKLQTGYNTKSLLAKANNETRITKIKTITIKADYDHDAMQKEVDRRVDDYLTNLAIAGMQPIPPKGNSGTGSDSSTLPISSIITGSSDIKPRLFESLGKFERRAIQRLIRSRDHAITRNIQCKSYLDELEAKMIPLREYYNSTK